MPSLPIFLLLLLPFLLLPILIFIIFQRFLRLNYPQHHQTIGVIVLGDAEHSPRTTSHVSSLLTSKYKVHLLAYHQPPSSLLQHPQAPLAFIFTRLPTPTSAQRSQLPYILSAILSLLSRGWFLLREVINHGAKWSCVVIQNPPCVPVFIVVGVGKLVFGWKVLVDWHNLAWTIMRASGVWWGFVEVAKVYECLGGRFVGDQHLCVSHALRKWLAVDVGVEAKVVYDRPRGMWVAREVGDERDRFIRRVVGGDDDLLKGWKSCRIRVVVSSTSWTPDEDFGILLEALKRVDDGLVDSKVRLVVVITGRGPMKVAFEQKMVKADLKRIRFRLVWLSYSDYLKLLRTADIGVSLHKSSSDLDLPMKVVDMFGCGLPVLSYRYKAIDELVLDGKNGYLFGGPNSLAKLLRILLDTDKDDKVRRMQENVERHFSQPGSRWDEYWVSAVLPLFNKLCNVE